MKHIITCLACAILLSVNAYCSWVIHKKIAQLEHPPKGECIKLEQPEFLMSDNPEKDLPKVLNYYGVMYPDIVRAQAILETGHFRSKVFREYNNLFGLYDSKNKDYFKFNHWTESVVAYLNCIQYRYKPPNNYYQFLEEIGYAEDPNYISKVKTLVNGINNDKE